MSEESRAKIRKARSERRKKFGYIVSPETRNKLREISLKRIAILGYNNSEETRAKISKANKGKRKTEEHKLKLSISLTGLPRPKHSIEQNKKHSEAMRGDKHPNWKGGITNKNIQLRNTIEYKKWRNEVYYRDNWTCIICLKYGGKLNADHIKPFAYYPELRFDIKNGRTLCIDCHKKTPTYGNKKQYALTEITKTK